MAKLKAPEGGSGLTLEQLAPAGQHVGVCVRVNDLFGVTRRKFQSQEEEEQDVTRFIFGFYGPDQKPYLVQTFEYRISGAPGSNLMGFLKAWVGKTPEMGWDYCAQLGQPAMLTIEHKPSKSKPGQIYADISGIGPVHPQMLQYVPPAAHFEPILKQLEQSRPQGQAQTPPPGSVPPANRSYNAPPQQPAPQQPAPTPPPVAAESFYVHVNGQTIEVSSTTLGSYPPATPACKKGSQSWGKVSDFAAAPPPQPAPPPPQQPPQYFAPPAQQFTPPPGGAPGHFTPPPGGGAADQDVPF